MDNPLWPPLMGNSRKKKKKLVQIKVRVDKSNTHSLPSAFTLMNILVTRCAVAKKPVVIAHGKNEHMQHLYHNVN